MLRSFEGRLDGTGRRGGDALAVRIAGMRRGHAAVKHDRQQTHCYTPGVIQTPTGLVTTPRGWSSWDGSEMFCIFKTKLNG